MEKKGTVKKNTGTETVGQNQKKTAAKKVPAKKPAEEKKPETPEQTAPEQNATTELPSREDLIETADEMNTMMGLDPKIPVDDDATDETIINGIKGNYESIVPSDQFSNLASDTFKKLGLAWPVPEPEPAPEPEKKTRKKEKKAGTTERKTRSSSKEKDEFGFSVGSRNNQFIEELKKGPKTMAEIKAADWNNGGTFYECFNALVKEGKAFKTEDGKLALKGYVEEPKKKPAKKSK